MTTDSRVKRLKDLMDQIERLPASPDRDHLLRQFRSRAVDVDTGVMPLAIVPLGEPGLPAPTTRPKPTKTEPSPPPRLPELPEPPTAPKHDHATSAAGSSANPDALLREADRLWLEESQYELSPLPQVGVPADRQVRPWTRGLRG